MAKIICRKTFRGRFDENAASQKGLTLIELALVIGIFALIILASLIALNALMEQRRITQAVTDVISVRSAVTKWAAGGPVTVIEHNERGEPRRDTSRTLSRWSQLAGFLPEPLERLAQKDSDATLRAANPWGRDYIITVFNPLTTSDGRTTITSSPWLWALTLVVPDDLTEPIRNAIRNAGALLVVVTSSNVSGYENLTIYIEG